MGEDRKTDLELQADASEGAIQRKERVRSTTKTQKSADTRRRIMDAAASLMVERGNTTFRMSEISQRCDMSKGALYYYFADKEDLLRAVYDREIDYLASEIDKAVGQAESGVDALRGACKAYAGCVHRGGPLAMAIVSELVAARENEEKSYDVRIHRIMGIIIEQLECAKQEGAIRGDVDVRKAAIAVCGAYAFCALDFANRAYESSDSEFTEELLTYIVKGLGV